MERKKVQVFQEKPEGFFVEVRVAAAYIEIDGKLLLLQSSEHKTYAKCWGLPAGKLEEGESAEAALRRELFEETGICLDPSLEIPDAFDFYVRKSNISYAFHVFRIDIRQVPRVVLSDEHMAYRWVPLNEVKTLPLIDAAHEVLEACGALWPSTSIDLSRTTANPIWTNYTAGQVVSELRLS